MMEIRVQAKDVPIGARFAIPHRHNRQFLVRVQPENFVLNSSDGNQVFGVFENSLVMCAGDNYVLVALEQDKTPTPGAVIIERLQEFLDSLKKEA